MNANLALEMKEEAPMGRVRADWWYDELTSCQCHLMKALEYLRHASEIGSHSVGSFVLETTDKIIPIEDTICALLGECVEKKHQIDDVLGREY